VPTAVSIVIPLFNEGLRSPLLADLRDFFGVPRDAEVILVETAAPTGRRDHRDELPRLPQFTLVRPPKEFGSDRAMAAGLEQAHGEITSSWTAISMNDPATCAVLAKMEERIRLSAAGGGSQGSRPHAPAAVSARERPHRLVTGIRLHDYGARSRRTRPLLKPLRLYSDMHRFIPALAFATGGADREIVVSHRLDARDEQVRPEPRVQGALDLFVIQMIVPLLERPMHFFGVVSILPGLSLIATGFWAATSRFNRTGRSSSGDHAPPLRVVPVLLFLGLLAELIHNGAVRSDDSRARPRDPVNEPGTTTGVDVTLVVLASGGKPKVAMTEELIKNYEALADSARASEVILVMTAWAGTSRLRREADPGTSELPRRPVPPIVRRIRRHRDRRLDARGA